MASPRTAEREEERRFNLRTLAIASSASATAAVVTSQLWIAGTWIAAAMTPVIVAFVSELLHRPAERLAGRLTSDRPVLQAERLERAEATRPANRTRADSERVATRDRGGAARDEEPGAHGPIRVYRTSPPPRRKRKIAVGAVLGTGALALLIAAVALTVPELIAGGAIGKSDRSTTLFSGRDRSSSSDQRQDQSQDQQQPAGETSQDRSEQEQPSTEAPTDGATTEVPSEEETTPTTPAPSEQPTDSAPAPAPAPAPTPTQP